MKIRYSKIGAVIVLEVAVAAGLLIGLWLGAQRLQRMQQHVVAAQHQIATAPQQQLAQEAISTELKKYAAAVTQLQQLIPPRSTVGNVIARIEGEASKKKLKAIVSDVKEEIKYGKNNKPIVQAGPYQEVRITVQSYGDPATLLELLYAIEHLPYVLKIPDWNITTDYAAIPAALTVAVPTPGASEERARGLLEASIIITINKDE